MRSDSKNNNNTIISCCSSRTIMCSMQQCGSNNNDGSSVVTRTTTRKTNDRRCCNNNSSFLRGRRGGGFLPMMMMTLLLVLLLASASAAEAITTTVDVDDSDASSSSSSNVCSNAAGTDTSSDETCRSSSSSSSQSTTTPTSSTSWRGEEINDIIEWIRTMKDGYVGVGGSNNDNDKFRIERIDYGTDNNDIISSKDNIPPRVLNPEYNFYASNDIPKNDILMTIHEDALFGFPFSTSTFLNSKSDSLSNSNSDYYNTPSSCQTVQNIVHGYLKDQTKVMALLAEEEEAAQTTAAETKAEAIATNPYLKFIFGIGNPKGKQPTSWSTTGKDILWKLLGDDTLHPYYENSKISYKKDCLNHRNRALSLLTILANTDINATNARFELEKDGYLYLKKHSWGTTLIPIFDLIQHRNGVSTNIDAKFIKVTETTIETITSAADTTAGTDTTADIVPPPTTATTTVTTDEVVVSMKKRMRMNDPFIIGRRILYDSNNDNNKDETTRTDDSRSSVISIKKYYKIVVFASRDIKKNEQLYTSHSNCEYLGCYNFNSENTDSPSQNKEQENESQMELSTQRVFSDFGQIENYPRRFIIDCDPFDDGYRIIFDIDRHFNLEGKENNGNKLFSFTWIKTSAITQQLYTASFLNSQKDRMYQVSQELHVLNNTVNSKYERNMILQIHAAYTEAFELAYMYRNHKINEVNHNNDTTISKVQTTNIQNNQIQDGMYIDVNYYDPLIEKKGVGITHHLGDWMTCAEGVSNDDGEELGKLKGYYQDLEFYYVSDVDNTYMNMATWLHSSSNFRAHYHEAAIHVPLQYIKDVKRVLYIGGGDNMVLHELLKYDHIELIVGMELDQQVSRSSLKYFGTSPFFHDPRVQWWYGDASKSLKVIPKEYFGSFDLVLMDLLSNVADSIPVVAGLNLIDIGPLLIKKDGGVLSRNEDQPKRSDHSRTLFKRHVEYDYWDIPRLCEQSVTVGSNSVDFFSADRYDHGVETLVRHYNESDFEGWSRYRDSSSTSSTRSTVSTPTPTATPTAHDSSSSSTSMGEQEVRSGADVNCKKIQTSPPPTDSKKAPLAGLLYIVEAENINLPLENNMAGIKKRIMDVINANGLRLLQPDHSSTSSEKKTDNNNTAVFIFEEGYIKALLYPDANYIAFDLMMWDSTDKSETIKEALIHGVGGNLKDGSTSSFRVAAGGMSGLKNRQSQNNGLLDTAEKIFCGSRDEDDDGDDTNDDIALPVVVNHRDDTPHGNHGKQSLPDQSIVIPELAKGLLPSKTSSSSSTAVFAILCGKEDVECASLQAVASSNSTNSMSFHSVYSCESFDDMPGCKSIVQERLNTVVADNKRLDGIIIDRSCPFDLGSIVHKVFNSTLNQERLLERSYVVLSPVKHDEEWRNVLLDRFRTEMVITYPLHRADIELYNETHRDEWCILSVRIHTFYNRLKKALSSIRDRAGLLFTTKEVEVGAIPLQFDFFPKSPSDSDFYRSHAQDQWFDQKPVAYQTLMQMELRRPRAPLSVNETVLVTSRETRDSGNVWVDIRYKAKVEKIVHGQYSLKMIPHELPDGSHHTPSGYYGLVGRDLIRKFSPNEYTEFSVGDWILLPTRDPDTQLDLYYAGLVTSESEAGLSIRYHDSDGFEKYLEGFPPEKVITAMESSDFLEGIDLLDASLVQQVFKSTLQEIGVADGGDFFLERSVIGDGLLLTAIWSEGNAVLKWNGLESIEVNMFVNQENSKLVNDFQIEFLDNFDYLEMVAQDFFPRGYNKVVNFHYEMEDYSPHWIMYNATDEDDEDDEYELVEEGDCNDDDDDYECIDDE